MDITLGNNKVIAGAAGILDDSRTFLAIQNDVRNAAISDIRAGGDVKKLNKLKVQLDRLNAIGGFDAVVPTEGIVFKYNGNTYKFTGAFAPINQITGLMFF